jgi:hypothetical protein
MNNELQDYFVETAVAYFKVATSPHFVALSSVVTSVLAIGPTVIGFIPGRGRWIFKGDKNTQHAFLWRGSKAVCPMS